MVDVVWRAYCEDANPGSMSPQTTVLRSWAEDYENRLLVVEAVARDFFSAPDEWEDWFGDEPKTHVMVEIASPSTIAGRYRANLELIVSVDAEEVEQ